MDEGELPLEGGEEPGALPCRAPGDETPFEEGEDEGPCFASQYQPAEGAEEEGGDLSGAHLSHAFRQMHRLIERLWGCNTGEKDLVEAVLAFYEQNIRSVQDYGPWSKRSIWRYIVQHSEHAMDRQALDNIKAIYVQIQHLRACAATRHAVTGEITPDLKTIRELANLVKVHSSLLTDYRRRAASK